MRAAGTLVIASDPASLTFFADRNARAKYITSICLGFLAAGAARLLKGYKSTFYWLCLDALLGFSAIATEVCMATPLTCGNSPRPLRARNLVRVVKSRP